MKYIGGLIVCVLIAALPVSAVAQSADANANAVSNPLHIQAAEPTIVASTDASTTEDTTSASTAVVVGLLLLTVLIVLGGLWWFFSGRKPK